MHSCGRCPTRWAGLRISHCGACHHTFSTPSNFDRHREGAVDRRRCVDPTAVGLAPNGNGVFYAPNV